jgi:hypothetical protein
MTIWNTLGTPKLRNAPPRNKNNWGLLGVWWLASLTPKDFYLYSWADEYMTHLPPIHHPKKYCKMKWDERQPWLKLGSREFSTPSYPPINTSPFRPVCCCMAFFSLLSAPLERSSSYNVLAIADSMHISVRFHISIVITVHYCTSYLWCFF